MLKLKMKIKNSKSAKGAWLIIGISFLAACIIAMFQLAEKPHIETALGEIPMKILLSKNLADQKQIYIENAGVFASVKSVKEIFDSGAIYLDSVEDVADSSPCGYNPYALLNINGETVSTNCFPEHLDSYESAFHNIFNNFLLADPLIPFGSFDYLIQEKKDSSNIYGLAKFPLDINIQSQLFNENFIPDFSGDLIWPTRTNSITITSCYGNRILNGRPNFHDGIDQGGAGFEIIAPADGTIHKICAEWVGQCACSLINDPGCAENCEGRCGNNGNYVIIEHNNNLYTKFSHLENINTRLIEGDAIRKGQTIGTAGNTGQSDGAHLHYSIYDSKNFGRDQGKSPLCFYDQAFLDTLRSNAESCREKYGSFNNFKKTDPDLVNECKQIRLPNTNDILDEPPESIGNLIDFSFLISDVDFVDQSISRDRIEDFLESVNSPLLRQRNGKIPFDMIMEEGFKKNINPIVLLATLQKETSLVERNPNNPRLWDRAFGCACPDTGGCSAGQEGFENQVKCAAETLKKHFDRAPSSPSEYPLLMDRINYDGSCPNNGNLGPNTVKVQNAATRSLYKYTPHTYDICLGSGTSGGGNYLFLKKFTEYYKEITGTLPSRDFSSGFTYGTYQIDPSFKIELNHDLDVVKTGLDFAYEAITDCEDDLANCFNTKLEDESTEEIRFYDSCDEHPIVNKIVEQVYDCVNNNQDGCYCNIDLSSSKDGGELSSEWNIISYQLQITDNILSIKEPNDIKYQETLPIEIVKYIDTNNRIFGADEFIFYLTYTNYELRPGSQLEVIRSGNDPRFPIDSFYLYKSSDDGSYIIMRDIIEDTRNPRWKPECVDKKTSFRFCAKKNQDDVVSFVENGKIKNSPLLFKAAVDLKDITPPGVIAGIEVEYDAVLNDVAIISWPKPLENDVVKYRFYKKDPGFGGSAPIRWDDSHVELIYPNVFESLRGRPVFLKDEFYFDSDTNTYYYAIDRNPDPWRTFVSVAAVDKFDNIWKLTAFDSVEVEGYTILLQDRD